MEYEDFIKQIGQNIKHHRIEKNLTLKQLGDKLGTKHNQIMKWEKGANFTMKTLWVISKELNVPISELLYK